MLMWTRYGMPWGGRLATTLATAIVATPARRPCHADADAQRRAVASTEPTAGRGTGFAPAVRSPLPASERTKGVGLSQGLVRSLAKGLADVS